MKHCIVGFRILVVFFVTLAALVWPGTTPVYAQSPVVDLVLIGAPTTQPAQGTTFSITVQVQAGAQPVDLAEVHLNFAPAILEVVSLAIPLNTPLPIQFVAPVFDNNQGHIDYAGGTFSNFPSGTFDLLIITFRVRSEQISTLSFAFEGTPRQTVVTGDGGVVLNTANSVDIPSLTVPITLGYFLAQPVDEGDVSFLWQTATETGTAGFNVLAEQDGVKTPLNSELIRSTVIDSVEPTNYTFSAMTDATAFYLSEMSIDGKIAEHGPFDQGVEYGVYALPANVELTPRIWLPLLER